ncbi:hypothetical protein FHY55_01570 [Oceanicola sp. D3]|uniref:hypothetical protein n=1 Tax=Oceanicola sp. D3 TaxID=2587163 RepID=UPI001123943D|nr:hypothetical protein [Oceanicola sp. D3]QDC08012.1 hypothetical protein FHY55_01570 [Oceanicola sp. D3]
MGWDDLISNTNYSNTCVTRTSYALQKAAFPVKSGAGMNALKGVNKGRAIEISQKRLSDYLSSIRDALATGPVPFDASLIYPLTR